MAHVPYHEGVMAPGGGRQGSRRRILPKRPTDIVDCDPSVGTPPPFDDQQRQQLWNPQIAEHRRRLLADDDVGESSSCPTTPFVDHRQHRRTAVTPTHSVASPYSHHRHTTRAESDDVDDDLTGSSDDDINSLSQTLFSKVGSSYKLHVDRRCKSGADMTGVGASLPYHEPLSESHSDQPTRYRGTESDAMLLAKNSRQSARSSMQTPAAPVTGVGGFLMAPASNRPTRTQSFKHRPSPQRHRFGLEDDGQRSSSPNVSRRTSLRNKDRSNGWRQPQTSNAAEKFLQLPESEDYTRLRQFDIDKKGCVINRGDSFRRKKEAAAAQRAQAAYTAGSASPDEKSSPSGSLSGRPNQPTAQEMNTSADPFDDLFASASAVAEEKPVDVVLTQPSTVKCYVYVLGFTGTGKTSLINQFMTSDHKNPFQNDDESFENTIPIVLEGEETEVVFFEADTSEDDSWMERAVSCYLLIYSIDSKSSFKHLSEVIARIRRNRQTQHKPIVIAANKIDLERKRGVKKEEAASLSKTYACPSYEVSVVLNHGCDELLVGLLAEYKENDRNATSRRFDGSPSHKSSGASGGGGDSDDAVSSAINRFSQRKKKLSPRNSGAVGGDQTKTSTGCASGGGFANRLAKFFKGKDGSS